MTQFKESEYVYVNNNPVEVLNFSGGELQVRIPQEYLWHGESEITAYLKSPWAIMEMLLTVDAMKRALSVDRLDRLVIPYFPYARQDRVCAPGEALSAKVMADLINGLGFHTVVIFEPHSPVSPALLNNCEVYTIMNVEGSDHFDSYDYLIAPDAGAEKRVAAIAQWTGKDMLVATKVRNTKTGAITRTELHSDADLTGKRVAIIDDICDGGATFVALAALLKLRGAARVDLWVSHGIFSKGIGALRPAVDGIYYFNTLNQQPGEGWDYLIANQPTKGE